MKTTRGERQMKRLIVMIIWLMSVSGYSIADNIEDFQTSYKDWGAGYTKKHMGFLMMTTVSDVGLLMIRSPADGCTKLDTHVMMIVDIEEPKIIKVIDETQHKTLMQQLRDKTSVSVGKYTFSAMGFSRIYKNVSRLCETLKPSFDMAMLAGTAMVQITDATDELKELEVSVEYANVMLEGSKQAKLEAAKDFVRCAVAWRKFSEHMQIIKAVPHLWEDGFGFTAQQTHNMGNGAEVAAWVILTSIPYEAKPYVNNVLRPDIEVELYGKDKVQDLVPVLKQCMVMRDFQQTAIDTARDFAYSPNMKGTSEDSKTEKQK